jgi:hypothetical protein
MNRKRLNKFKRQLHQLRRSSARASDVEALAFKLGRKKREGKRSKEPTWLSTEFDNLPPLSIPHHGGRDLPIGTKNSILSQLEDDIAEWEQRLDVEDGDPDEPH